MYQMPNIIAWANSMLAFGLILDMFISWTCWVYGSVT